MEWSHCMEAAREKGHPLVHGGCARKWSTLGSNHHTTHSCTQTSLPLPQLAASGKTKMPNFHRLTFQVANVLGGRPLTIEELKNVAREMICGHSERFEEEFGARIPYHWVLV